MSFFLSLSLCQVWFKSRRRKGRQSSITCCLLLPLRLFGCIPGFLFSLKECVVQFKVFPFFFLSICLQTSTPLPSLARSQPTAVDKPPQFNAPSGGGKMKSSRSLSHYRKQDDTASQVVQCVLCRWLLRNICFLYLHWM